MSRKTLILLLSLVLAIPSVAPSQTAPAPEQRPDPKRFVYQWTDDKGEIHMTDDQGQVPKQYQSKSLKERAEPRKEEGRENHQGETTNPAPESAMDSDLELEQRRRREEWRQQFLEWKEKLREAEKSYQSLKQKRTSLITPWGSTSMAPIAVREEVARVDNSLQQTQAEIEEARHMVEDVLPDEARKVGVPPGWLRE